MDDLLAGEEVLRFDTETLDFLGFSAYVQLVKNAELTGLVATIGLLFPTPLMICTLFDFV